jgi:hypothetical protein
MPLGLKGQDLQGGGGVHKEGTSGMNDWEDFGPVYDGSLFSNKQWSYCLLEKEEKSHGWVSYYTTEYRIIKW